MTHTYTQLCIHIVCAVKDRQCLIPKQHKKALHQYITRIVTDKKQTVIWIDSSPYRIHILVGMAPDTVLSALVRDIKANSSKFINKKGWGVGRFEWQAGFAAFSYSHSQLDAVVDYIKNQEARRSRRTFKEEDLGFLERFDVPYNPNVFDSDDTAKT